MSEADVHFEFYRFLQNAIDDKPQRGGIEYGYARPEYNQGISGRADIVVFDSDDDPVFVIEAKRPDGASSRDIDPYAPSVIKQAFGYAGGLGAPFFCTFNGERLVIFRTYEEGVALLERSTKAYTIANLEEFANTLLNEIANLERGKTDWDTLDTTFIERVNSLHEYVSPRLEDSFEDHLEDDEDFRQSFSDWTGKQGFDYEGSDEENREALRKEFADQSAYLLINKVIFYKILEDSPTYSTDLNRLAVRKDYVRDDLEDAFTHIVEEIDFEAIYEHDDIYSEIPLDRVAGKIQEFVEELDSQNLTQFDSDIISHIYEGVIPPERRREMGEYYTPPAICDLITRLTVEEPDDTVFDPAVGSGGFLVSAYHRLKNTLPEPKGSHNRILEQLYATEINRFPAHLTTINLAIQDLSSYTDEVNVEVSDFFDVKPGYLRLGREVASAEGGKHEEEYIDEIGGFDSVVANPPYIRQENIKDKTKVREHLTNREIDSNNLSKRCDIFAYFITHATEFLDEEGNLGFIISDRWLDTQYGEDVQQFILEKFEIKSIIKFDRQVFDDALVDASVIILRRQLDESERDSNVAKFIRLKQELGIDEIANLVREETDANKLISNEAYRLVPRRQATLKQENKWNVFFFAPPIHFELDAHPKVRELSEIAEVSYGIKTGANKFFYDHTEEMEELGLGSYTSFALKATGQVESIKVTQEDAKEWSIIDVHDLVEEATTDSAGFGTTDEEQVKEWLEENDHDTLLEYIWWGEDQEYHKRSSIKNRDVWFDLDDLPRPKILSTMFTWRTHRVFWNEAEAPTSDQFYYIHPKDDLDEKLLAALLNSRTVWLSNELKGRRAGGQGMARLQTKVYETEQWTVPNPQAFPEGASEEIKSAFDHLMEKEEELEEPTLESTEKERDQLDQSVLKALGLDESLDELKESIDAMLQMREEGAGQLTSVLVGRRGRKEDGSEIVDLPGVESARESTTLGDFE